MGRTGVRAKVTFQRMGRRLSAARIPVTCGFVSSALPRTSGASRQVRAGGAALLKAWAALGTTVQSLLGAGAGGTLLLRQVHLGSPGRNLGLLPRVAQPPEGSLQARPFPRGTRLGVEAWWA